MDSAFSRPLSEHYCPYSVVSPSAGHALKHAHAQFHPARLRHTLPLLIYPRTTEPRLYDASYPGAAAPLMPYLSPFHGRFGVYECALEPAFIQKRNERERQRVKCVNQGYAKLREHLPGAAADKRMSKVETLRAAIRYIKHLQRLVEEHETSVEDVHADEEDSPLQLSITSSPVNCCDASQDSSGT
ncbi:achaete-scute homolog 5-like [Ictalurus punctatus]|uniref:Achaete-scute homolog 5-like n=1 Tax=Ictalurus punctatus TaxID=7998 RepID=A0A9F7TB56_ICTPU|nr:achaete-scute homolog 5-like [Ictalurus punctatus]